MDEPWSRGALTCGDRLTSDAAMVVTGYELAWQRIGRDTAFATVRYRDQHVLTWEGDSLALRPASADATERIVVLRTDRGWRIEKAPVGAQLSAVSELRGPWRLNGASHRALNALRRP